MRKIKILTLHSNCFVKNLKFYSNCRTGIQNNVTWEFSCNSVVFTSASLLWILYWGDSQEQKNISKTELEWITIYPGTTSLPLTRCYWNNTSSLLGLKMPLVLHKLILFHWVLPAPSQGLPDASWARGSWVWLQVKHGHTLNWPDKKVIRMFI